MKTRLAAIFTAVLFLQSIAALSQEAVPPRESPLSIIRLRYKDAYLKITYSQPHKRDREVFGKLVPFGQVWRTGANEATEITLTKDITINSILLKAGTYSLFTIPEADKWTIIINSEPGLWGAYNYNQKLDVFRFEVPVTKSKVVFEAFTMQLNGRNEIADLIFNWDDTQVIVPIKFLN